MRPPLSITKLMSPTFAIGANKSSFWPQCQPKKTKNQIKLSNGFVKAGITEKTTTNEIAAEDESDTEDIASDTETLPDELMDMIDGIGFSSESDL